MFVLIQIPRTKLDKKKTIRIQAGYIPLIRLFNLLFRVKQFLFIKSKITLFVVYTF
jgi:hypothetical protein